MSNGSRVVLRIETPGDQPAVRRVNVEAFGRPDEADLVDRLRSSGAVSLSMVAEVDGEIVGHLLFSPVTVTSDGAAPRVHAGVGLAPVAVALKHQGQGVGSALIRAALEILKSEGHSFVVVLGHPTYYPRFGFERASTWQIRSTYEVRDEAFMVQALRSGGLDGVSGLARYRPEFDATVTDSDPAH